MKTYLILFIISGAVALLAFHLDGSSLHSTGVDNRKEATPASSLMQRVPVDAYPVKVATTDDELLVTGTIAAHQAVDLVSEVTGKITAIHAKDGSFVQEGALLFTLDDGLQARRTKLKRQEKLARLDEKRSRELLATGSVNQQEYDQILTHLKALQAEIARVDGAPEKNRIQAPFAGRVGLNRVAVGASVKPGTVLATLQDVRWVAIHFTLPEKYASVIKPGQLIRFTTKNSSLPFRGKIVVTELKTDSDTRSLLVMAVSKNPDGKLVPGTSAKISFSL